MTDADSYMVRYGIDGETPGNRIYYTEVNSFDLLKDVIFHDTGGTGDLAGKKLDVSVAASRNTYVGTGADDVEKAIDAANKMMTAEGSTLVWSTVEQFDIPSS
ncbi:hypothetical protein LP032_051 [Listeria phage LP-032]|uniref:Uncharacterized protein n=2 Tax=Homburgvirus LP26 TaxID=1921126 RepID=A0A059TA25_9CAUD|nr:hypothetical protein LP026_111 [Listeria phage LP-026]AHL18900.1 hypothetical protein LP032_051 [Listeria phage LP-032]AHN84805.1 hypothetical protein LP026_111 [Listeria phage LP-026]